MWLHSKAQKGIAQQQHDRWSDWAAQIKTWNKGKGYGVGVEIDPLECEMLECGGGKLTGMAQQQDTKYTIRNVGVAVPKV